MESSSNIINPSNSSFTHQNSPTLSLSNSFTDTKSSTSMSTHLHSATRRTFIGPTASNWPHKKTSYFFIKSNDSKSQVVKKRSSQQSRNIIKGGETQITSTDSRDAASSSKIQRSLIAIADSQHLISEPQRLQFQNSSNITESPSSAYYTPAYNLNSNPITPQQSYFPLPNEKIEQSLPKNSVEDRTSHTLSSPIVIEDENKPRDDKKMDDDENYLDSECSCNLDEGQFEQENNDMNQNSKHVKFSSTTASANYQPNTIIRQDQMLVRIGYEEFKEHPLLYKKRSFIHDFFQISKWKEFMVKLKPGVIELYKNEDKILESIPFTSKTKFSLFSSSDYTILLSQPMKHYVKNFIFNPKTISLCVQWYQALYDQLSESINKPIPPLLGVTIPDLDVKLQIPIYQNDDDENFSLSSMNAEKVMNIVLNELNYLTEQNDVLDKWKKSKELRLCWKRFERLEWIDEKDVLNDLLKSPQFIEQTHQLQLRPIEHYPTSVKFKDGTILTEPPSIEGYLIKITNDRGQTIKSKRLYFASQNNYLFFMNQFNASPPPPPNVSTMTAIDTSDNNGIQLCDNTQHYPLIYEISPSMNSDMNRRVNQILCAKGFIDLTEIVEIKYLEEGLEADEVNEGEGSPFQLIKKNGKIITLKSYSRQTREEWINHLNELIKYWKARVSRDVRIRVEIIKTNQSKYHDTADEELYHWRNSRSYANPILWNWCVLDRCRGIIKAGWLYNKTHIVQQFDLHHHVLTHGYLIYFNRNTRSTLSRYTSKRSYHKHKGCINLRDCYVYSGEITEHEYYDSNRSQERSIAKSYNNGQFAKIYGDGMVSYDNYKDTSFVIWKSKRKYYFDNDGMKIQMNQRIQFNTRGNFWVFRARSRVECEEWVWALNAEIERLYKNENA
ncbi:16620_t:CDS:2 [Funneliformis geosporum]|uniref:7025_t:CDS:1 n=1 Tax=Funneliformis geosporum TaxID=1117311 RepID=A0A9W4SXW7_9GLOM|nr:16620_t:CDS:2 [Funneliformis geosporum]CAI2184706.1 7025_t:CDS:2 [Funneliformis geosporum]